MIIASAQTRPYDEDVDRNLRDHCRLIKLAADHGVNLIAFPEMSITGYLRAAAAGLAFTDNDPRLDKLREMAAAHSMIVIAGAPLKLKSGLHIGAFVLYPDGQLAMYAKRYLHSGEDDFFTASFAYNPVIELDNEKICLAICADIDNPAHAEAAHQAKCTIYVAGIFFTPGGIAGAYDMLSGYAKRYAMNVLMANYCGQSFGLAAAGRSALWGKDGTLLAGLDADSTGLVIGRQDNGGWLGTVVKDK